MGQIHWMGRRGDFSLDGCFQGARAMARIREEEIERIKREISLERLAEAKGVKLKQHGENQLGRCPFHDDKTPSLVITPSKNLWHCL
jgi:hypothetical protein